MKLGKIKRVTLLDKHRWCKHLLAAPSPFAVFFLKPLALGPHFVQRALFAAPCESALLGDPKCDSHRKGPRSNKVLDDH